MKGGGGGVIVVDVFDVRSVTFSVIQKKYFSLAILVHPAKRGVDASDDMRNSYLECIQLLSNSYNTARLYAERRAAS